MGVWETAVLPRPVPLHQEEPSMTVLEVAHATSTTSPVSEDAVQRFAAQLRGPLIRPGDAEYAAARRVYNGMIDRYPALIACCANVADVMASVNFAREQRLTVAV